MPLGMEVGLCPGDSVLDGDQVPFPQKGAEPPSPIFGPFRLWPNGWMHQDATWYGGRPQPRGLCVRWGPSPLPKMRWSPGTEPPVFGPCLFWPNSWMHQDATWYGDRSRPMQHCVRCGPSYPQKKGRTHPHPILAHVYCGHGRPSQLLLSSCYGRPTE